VREDDWSVVAGEGEEDGEVVGTPVTFASTMGWGVRRNGLAYRRRGKGVVTLTLLLSTKMSF